ncbi:hypothetical protein D3C84_632880 [compost metagenome]
MQSNPSDGHFRRSANTAHKATLTAAANSNNVACRLTGAKRSTSLIHASAHQPAPHTNNTSDKRFKLNGSNAAPWLPSCKRQAPTSAARPSNSGVQKPP